jgi:sugar/nucleoside kinase (ribokinase family)
MNILVLGHCCLDVIHTPSGEEIRSFGGIVYAAAALGVLMERKETVTPVFGVNRLDRDALLRELEQYPAIDTSGIYTFDEPTNQVHLFYGNGAGRTECSQHISPPIPFEKLRPHLETDGILVNMISGYDVTLETLDQIRMQFRGRNTHLHFDFHSLTLGVQEDGKRFRRPIDTWRRWAFMSDTVQLNEEEIAGMAVEKLSEAQAAGHLLTLGPRGVVITRGENGASLYTNLRKSVVRQNVAGVAVTRAADSTGCGDVFGAAFLLQALRTKDLPAAAVFANEVAGRKAGLTGTQDLRRLRPDAAAA